MVGGGVLGPLLITTLLPGGGKLHGLSPDAYALPLRVMAGLLVAGLVCNLLIKPTTAPVRAGSAVCSVGE